MKSSRISERLDERLIEVTLRLLAEEGLEGLTLRRIARASGVSHGAPLRHFRSLADLLAEVAARGFAMLSEAIEKSGAKLDSDAGPMLRLQAAGRAYVKVAVANPALFALMFRPDQLDAANTAFASASTAAFDHLLHHVGEAQAAGWHAERDTRLLAGSVWAPVHGFASLWAQGAFSAAVPRVSFEKALSTTLELVLGHPQGDSK